MKTTKLAILTITLLLLSGITFSTFAVEWIESAGLSCAQVCLKNDKRPFQSGTYQNGNDFYVCAGNANGEGFRAGYNLAPTWAATCTVGWGGKELALSKYKCLCK